MKAIVFIHTLTIYDALLQISLETTF